MKPHFSQFGGGERQFARVFGGSLLMLALTSFSAQCSHSQQDVILLMTASRTTLYNS